MSRIYFHSKTHETEVHGSERANMGRIVTDMSMAMLGIEPGDSFAYSRGETIRDIVVGPSYAPMPPKGDPGSRDYAAWVQWSRPFVTAMRVDMSGPVLRWRGHNIGLFGLHLNTALVVGGDAVKLAARIHGQCEIHGWVDESNRAWLADIAESGVDAGIFRASRDYERHDGEVKSHDLGWRATIAHLRAVAEHPGPVVTSYSVCEQFPNRAVLGLPMADDDAADAWDDMPDDEKWDRAMVALRERSGGLEIKPDNWTSFYFDAGVTMFDLVADDRDERFARRLEK